jgi:N-acylneuraminate cytidylyltransferase
MKTVAFIPLRSGSKSIPGKNIKLFAGKPLVCWVLEAALGCPGINEVFVATDGDEIAAVVRQYFEKRVTIISRSQASVSDCASSEIALLEFCNNFNFDNVFLIQATSPLLRSIDLVRAIEKFSSGEYDSLLSVVRQKRFIWSVDNHGYAKSVNYDPFQRPRRQDWDGFFVENGAFYFSSREAILRHECRLSGKIGIYEMPEESYNEIDEAYDWVIVEQLLLKRFAAI